MADVDIHQQLSDPSRTRLHLAAPWEMLPEALGNQVTKGQRGERSQALVSLYLSVKHPVTTVKYVSSESRQVSTKI